MGAVRSPKRSSRTWDELAAAGSASKRTPTLYRSLGEGGREALPARVVRSALTSPYRQPGGAGMLEDRNMPPPVALSPTHTLDTFHILQQALTAGSPSATRTPAFRRQSP